MQSLSWQQAGHRALHLDQVRVAPPRIAAVQFVEEEFDGEPIARICVQVGVRTQESLRLPLLHAHQPACQVRVDPRRHRAIRRCVQQAAQLAARRDRRSQFDPEQLQALTPAPSVASRIDQLRSSRLTVANARRVVQGVNPLTTYAARVSHVLRREVAFDLVLCFFRRAGAPAVTATATARIPARSDRRPTADPAISARSAIMPKNTLPAYERMLTPIPIDPLCGTQKYISEIFWPHMYSGACGPGTFDATSEPLRLNISIAGRLQCARQQPHDAKHHERHRRLQRAFQVHASCRASRRRVAAGCRSRWAVRRIRARTCCRASSAPRPRAG